MPGKMSNRINDHWNGIYNAHKVDNPIYSINAAPWRIFAYQTQFGDGKKRYRMIGVDQSRPKNKPTIMKSVEVLPHIDSVTIKDIVLSVFFDKIDLGRRASIKQISCRNAIRLFGLDGNNSSIIQESSEALALSVNDLMRENSVDFSIIEKSVKDRFQKNGLSEFQDLMDIKAIQALESMDDFSWAEYAFYAEKGVKGERRKQAAAVYPLLASNITSRLSIKSAVDNENSLNDPLMKSFGTKEDGSNRVSKGLLKRLQGVHLRQEGDVVPNQKIISDLIDLPPDWAPSSEQEWDAYITLSASVGTILQNSTGMPLSTLYDGCKGKWLDFLRRCAIGYRDTRPPEGLQQEDFDKIKGIVNWKSIEKADWEDRGDIIKREIAKIESVPDGVDIEDLQNWLDNIYTPDCSKQSIVNASRDINDLITQFANNVMIPLLVRLTDDESIVDAGMFYDNIVEQSAKILFANKSAPNIFEIGRKWHNRLAEFNEEIYGIDKKVASLKEHSQKFGPNGWAGLTDDIVAPNGVFITVLNNADLLSQEGRSLNHCVGGYNNTCKRMGHHIISFRESDNKGNLQRLSTLEIGPVTRTSSTIDVLQHRGRGNKNPPQKAAEAQKWFVRNLESGAIPIHFDSIEESLALSTTKTTKISNLCGYNFRNSEYVSRAFDIWKDFMPKQYRKMNIREFSTCPEVQDVINEINSSYSLMKSASI